MRYSERDYPALKAKAVHLWNTEPEMSRADIARRLGLADNYVGKLVRDALEVGTTTRTETVTTTWRFARAGKRKTREVAP